MKPNATNWVTIPEEKIHTPVSAPAATQRVQAAAADDAPVAHKIFWGIGFVVMIVIATGLLAPKETLKLLQGNLFETTGEATPAGSDEGIQPLTLLPASTEGAAETTAPVVAETPGTTSEEAVIPSTEATTIQVEPIAVTPVPVTDTTSPENLALLEQLNQQVQAVNQNIATPEVRPSAPEVVTPVVTAPEAVIPEVVTAVPEPVPAPAPIPVPTSTQTTYKANTHVASKTPAQVLAQNEAAVQAKQGSAVGTVTPDYSANLGNVNATPESGPRETLLMALALTFLSMFGYKFARSYSRR